MANLSFSPETGALLVCSILSFACADPDLPQGPCNDDGETEGVGDEREYPASQPPESESDSGADPTSFISDIRPSLPSAEGWLETSELDGFYRVATTDELRRFKWPEHTLLLATPFGVFEPGEQALGNQAWITVPTWLAESEAWATDNQMQVRFTRQEFSKVQTLSLGHFVEHHRRVDGSTAPAIHRPIFEVFGAEDSGADSRAQLLSDSTGGVLFRRMSPEGGVELSAPHTDRQLDVATPAGFQVAIVSPSVQDITRGPLTPFNCESGECEEPDDPLDECNDGMDNDGDGHSDLCDWNCLPHADYGADQFPEARSRVEQGKSYAMMGGGSLCTKLGDTWMVTFADWALQASELLNDVRPEINDPVHFRIFSCWVFETTEAFELCQYGPYEIVDGEAEYSAPICPVGLEDYPYQPTQEDQLNDKDQGNLLFDEATRRAWSDLQLNTLALGPYGEPVNGTIFLSADTLQTCKTLECAPVAGLSVLSPFGDLQQSGSAVVTDANPYDWHTLAHEVGHTLGLVHDDFPNGFMSPTPAVVPGLGVSVDPDHPGVDNSHVWDFAFDRKGERPRSSGWFHTGCTGADECAPLGKPGWSCNNNRCEQD